MNRLERIGKRAGALGELVVLMRELYFSAPLARSGRWDEAKYLQKQQRMDEILQFWFTSELEDNFALRRLLRKGRLLNARVRPHSLALFRALKRLAGGDGIGGEAAPLLASILIPDAGTGTRELVLVWEPVRLRHRAADPEPSPKRLRADSATVQRLWACRPDGQMLGPQARPSQIF